jgi:hypothetical protein
LKKGDLKLLRAILCQGSNDEMLLKTTVRRYLIDCLFECDEGDLPDEALRAIALCNQMPLRQKIDFTEQRKGAELEAVLNVSSSLRALVYHCTGGQTDDQLMNCESECHSDEQVMSLGCDDYSCDNDFVLTEGYKNFGHQQHKIDEACSSSMVNPVSVSGHFSSGAGSNMKKPTLHEVVGANEVEIRRSSMGLSEICDDAAILAHKLLGKILDNTLLAENKVNGLAGYSLDGSTSHGPQGTFWTTIEPSLFLFWSCFVLVCNALQGSYDIFAIDPAEKNQKADIVIKAIENVLPNLPKRSFFSLHPFIAYKHTNTICLCSCMDKVRRMLHDDKQ